MRGVDDAHGDACRKERVSPMKRRQAAARLGRPSPATLVLELADRIKAMSPDQRGVAAIEFGIFAPLLFLALVNVADVTIYLYQRMQVQNATEVAAQAAWKTCDLTALPLTTDCSTLAASVTAVQNALASTSLGTAVSLVSGSPSVGYYCVNSSNALQYVSAISSKPADCTAAGTPSLQPGYYIQVQTTYTYTPIFPGMSISGTFPTPINSASLMRLG
jgi:Flp pilus assembly protein TadG